MTRRKRSQSVFNEVVNESATAASELSIELFERSAVVLDLEPAQIDAWCSGLWAAWESDDEVRDFIGYCAETGGQVAALVAASLTRLADAELSTLAAAVATTHGAGASEHALGERTRIIEAWQVDGPASRSIVLGCGTGTDSDHAVLIELNGAGELVDLLLSGDPRELVYGVERHADAEVDAGDDEKTGLEDLSISTLAVDAAVAQATDVWLRAAAEPALWPSTVRANEHVVRHRLEVTLPRLLHERLDLDLQRGLDDTEFAQANAAALSTLQSALGRSTEDFLAVDDVDAGVEAAWVAMILGEGAGLPAEEQRALLFLEWADWLGAGIGMSRAGVGAPVDGEALVDLVNRCPEVSTSIEKRDRAYVAFAFDVALETITDVGGVVDGVLTASGHAALTKAMAAAWSATSPLES